MMELKTLKEIYGNAPTPNHGLEAYTELLKEEAINHIKQLRDRISKLVAKDDFESTKLVQINSAQIVWIKYFFNIEDKEIL